MYTTELFHATSAQKAAAILNEGLNPGSYLAADLALAQYYAETIEDEGLVPVILQLNCIVSDEHFEPDYPGLEEPVLYPNGTFLIGLLADCLVSKGILTPWQCMYRYIVRHTN